MKFGTYLRLRDGLFGENFVFVSRRTYIQGCLYLRGANIQDFTGFFLYVSAIVVFFGSSVRPVRIYSVVL